MAAIPPEQQSLLRNVADLRGYGIQATDGLIGTVDDLYFDDEAWAIRYFVVDTGGWLSGRQVLISPFAIGHPDWLRQLLPASVTKSQIEHSPSIDTKRPVSRQHEADYLRYFAYPSYWGGTGLWGMNDHPLNPGSANAIEARPQGSLKGENADDCHLRSCRTVVGYQLHAKDGDLGHVADFLVDQNTWAIRYLIVETGHWWAGHQVLIAPSWLVGVNWSDRSVSADLTRQAIKECPVYNAAAQLDRQQEESIYLHHGRPDYWTTKASRDTSLPDGR